MLRQICVALTIAAIALAAAMSSAVEAREVQKDPQGRSIWTKQTLEMKVKAAGDVENIATVELWYRPEGGEWARWDGAALPDDTVGIYRVKFTAPHTGVYEFFSVSVDKDGNASAAPTAESTPMITIRFDYEFPEITLAFADESTTVAPGGQIRFNWSATDAAMKNARIAYYFDANEQDTKHIELNGASGSDEIAVPKDGVASVTIYMVAEDFGGLKTVSKKKTFKVARVAVETEKPEAPLPVEPQEKADATEIRPVPEKNDTESGSAIILQAPKRADAPTPKEKDALKVTLRYDVTTVGLSGLDRVELWVARVEGEDWRTKNWTLHETAREAKGEFVFVPEEIGHYAFYIVAGNKAGLWSRPRPDGKTRIEADYSKWLDDQKPTLEILSPRGDDVFRGGAKIAARWQAQDNNLLERPIKIELLRDGNMIAVLVEATENSGEFEFDAPATQGSYAIRITAADQAGHTTVMTGEPFIIDTCPPRVTIEILDDNGLPLAETPEAETEKSCAPDETDEKTGEADAAETCPQDAEKEATDAAESALGGLMRGREFLQKDEIEKATAELARAAELAPGDHRILNEYGIALYRGGRYAEALANFTRAAGFAPGDARYRWNIFLCNYALKDADGAAASALAALRADGNLAEAREMIDAVLLLYRNAGRANETAGFLNKVLAVEGISEKVRQHARSRLS